jgi:hypothetical protein
MYTRCLLTFAKHIISHTFNTLYEFVNQGILFRLVKATRISNTGCVKLQAMSGRLFKIKPWSKASGWPGPYIVNFALQYMLSENFL